MVVWNSQINLIFFLYENFIIEFTRSFHMIAIHIDFSFLNGQIR